MGRVLRAFRNAFSRARALAPAPLDGGTSAPCSPSPSWCACAGARCAATDAAWHSGVCHLAYMRACWPGPSVPPFGRYNGVECWPASTLAPTRPAETWPWCMSWPTQSPGYTTWANRAAHGLEVASNGPAPSSASASTCSALLTRSTGNVRQKTDTKCGAEANPTTSSLSRWCGQKTAASTGWSLLSSAQRPRPPSRSLRSRRGHDREAAAVGLASASRFRLMVKCLQRPAGLGG